MTDPKHTWQRLAAAARRLPEEPPAEAPPGFATRVAALAMAPGRPAGSHLLGVALRAMGAACLIALAAVALNVKVIAPLFDDEAAPVDDPVAELVDLGS
jgi:hypothetical protein